MKADQALRIVFMGTPDFAVASLRALVEGGFTVVGVVTAPDKPSPRGHKPIPTPVKEYALQAGLPVLQPEKLKAPEFLEQLRAWQADLQVVVAFRMLPEVVWNMPPRGTINLHASLLPQYRGAAPINWAIINGETETGCTTFFLQHEIDTGDLIFQHREPISESDTIGTLYERLMHAGAGLLLKTVAAIADGTAPSVPQDHSAALKHAPKIFRDTCQINWQQTATQVHNLVRGLSPYPAAWTELNGKVLKVYASQPGHAPQESPLQPGQVFQTKNELWVGCGEGTALQLLEIQLEGKKRMRASEFLVGNRL